MGLCVAPDCNSPEVPTLGDEELHYGCSLRQKGVALSTKATPNRSSLRSTPTQHRSDPAWERGMSGERRPDGSFMPHLGSNREPIRVKEAGERRHDIDAQVHRLRNDPSVFSSERST